MLSTLQVTELLKLHEDVGSLPDASTVEFNVPEEDPCPKLESIPVLSDIANLESDLLSYSGKMGDLLKDIEAGRINSQSQKLRVKRHQMIQQCNVITDGLPN